MATNRRGMGAGSAAFQVAPRWLAMKLLACRVAGQVENLRNGRQESLRYNGGVGISL
jgi:hypothetical protein